MDAITRKDYSKNDIEKFVWMAYWFNWNRFYNSFDGVKKIGDRIYECDTWFNKYKWFVDKLDQNVYNNEIVKYYTQCTGHLYLLATTLRAQENKYRESIDLLKKGAGYLEQIKEFNDTIPIKIASYYAEIANDYLNLGELTKSKEFCDKAIPYIFYTDTYNLDCCTVLGTLSNIYFSLNQYNNAVEFKKLELELRKSTEMPPTCSDYALFMTYNSIIDTDENIRLGNKLEQMYGDSDKFMSTVYRMMADAFSKKMHSSKQKNDKDSVYAYERLYEKYIDKTKEIIQLYRNEYFSEDQEISWLYQTISSHLARKGNVEESFKLAEKALLNQETIKNDDKYFDVSVKAAAIHNEEAMHKYLPKYYQHIKSELLKIMPMLGSVESGLYMVQGSHILYRMPELATWNPNDSLCTSIAYDVSLLIKGIVMQFSSLAPSIGDNLELNAEYSKLNKLKDSIYTIKNEYERIHTLYNYELRERAVRNRADEKKQSHLYAEWTDIRNSLKDNEIAVEFFCYVKNCHAWINDTTCNHYIALLIDKKSTNPVIVDLFDEKDLLNVYNYQPKSYVSKDGVSLYNLLWKKLSPYLDDKKKVYFSPMGSLCLINIEALQDENGIPACQKYALRRLSSTKQILDSDKSNDQYEIALFGGIDYTGSKEHLVFNLDNLNTRGNWAYLSGTKREIDNIFKECSTFSHTHTISYIGSNATEESFKNIALTKTDIIHIASHGFYIPEEKRENIPYYQSELTKLLNDNLFYSGLVFAGGQKSWNESKFQLEANDGLLTAYEISKMNLSNVDMVVLSACETGRGDRSYDGIIGLQRAFKMAGVKTLIMSLWKVDDAATSFMMETFYKEYLSTGSKHKAFKSAQSKVKEKYENPYYWASFIMLD